MANITLTIPEELQQIVKKHNEINWSEIARRAMWNHAKKIELMDKLVKNSKLKEDDIDEIDHLIKKSLHKRYSK